jgi:hypothetical protein
MDNGVPLIARAESDKTENIELSARSLDSSQWFDLFGFEFCKMPHKREQLSKGMKEKTFKL